MSKRIEQSRKNGPFDSRYPTLFRLVTSRNPTPLQPPPGLTEKADPGPSVPS